MVGLILGLSFPTAPLTLQAAQKTIIEISEEGNITLVVKKKSLRSVLSDIEKNSKYVFGYNSNLPYLAKIHFFGKTTITSRKKIRATILQ